MKKILYIAAHRKDRAPNQRYRFEQFMDFLYAKGFECHISSIIPEKEDTYLYAPGHLFKKFFTIFIKHKFLRFKDLFSLHNYDIILIAREALLTRSTFFEHRFRKSNARIVFDFDDAIWLLDVSPANQKYGWLKSPKKTSVLISLADHVIAGNKYLSDYALQFNPNTSIIPTTVDTNIYKPSDSIQKNKKVCIGWSGSITTIPHFEMLIPVLVRLKEYYGEEIEFKVIGDKTFHNTALGIQGIAWTKDSEIPELNKIDIGIMPLPDTEWAKGKCGLKGLVYMSMGIPAVMSPVGVNTEIIDDGVNGFLAATDEEWLQKLSLLIDSPELRSKIGANGKQKVIHEYSMDAWKERYLSIFQKLTE